MASMSAHNEGQMLLFPKENTMSAHNEGQMLVFPKGKHQKIKLP